MSSAVACAQGLPSGAQIVNGQADVTQNGSSLAVRQASPTAIISWDQFSIGQPNSVHFDNGVGSTLNRVRGNIASQIDGSLTATGSVYLINPAGIAVGPTGRIETGGSFIGSTLDISDDEFQKAARGEAHTFKGTSGAAVRNAGRIGALGGSVVLMGRTVENEGDIEAPNGTAALVAGTEVLVQDRSLDGGRFVVKAGGSGTSVKNTGNIKAAEVELRANGGNVYALAGNKHGVIAATGTSKQGGRVFLTAGDTGTVEVTQHVSARKVATAANRSRNGGDIRVSGKTIKVAATLDASGLLPPVRPDELNGNGGTVIVAGDNITLTDAARVDVSGAKGGIALIGGDYQGGANTAANYVSEKVSTAKLLTVAKGAVITADASEGNGGKIVLWSDLHTDFAGHVSATSVTGLGGDAEVSGKATLAFNGTANLLGQAGAGTLLLDPYNLTIVAGSGGSVTPVANDSTLGVDTLTGLLASANTVVTTGSGGAQLGNIIVNAAITWNAATTLTLNAANTIAINAAITAVNGGLTLKAASGTEAAPTITTGAGGTINVGTFSLETGAWVQKSATLPAFAAQAFHLAYDSKYSPTVIFLRATSGTGVDAANSYKIADLYGLQGMASMRSKHFALVADIDATSTANWYGGQGFLPIGVSSASFFGSFDGQGHIIAGLTINRPSQDYVGLFGMIGSSGTELKNIGLVGGVVRGRNRTGSLAGYSSDVSNSFSTIAVEGNDYAGGLVGFTDGTIKNSYASGSVKGWNYVGGLLGQAGYRGIATSYAAGDVTGNDYVGGLVGNYSGSSSSNNVYATGSVTGSKYVGGLVGYWGGASNSYYAYASGKVTGTTNTGSLFGGNSYNNFYNAYSLSTANAFTQANYSGFNFTGNWYMVDGETRPFLRMELDELAKTYDAAGNVIAGTYTIRTANQLQLIKSHEGATSSGKTYILANDIDMTAALSYDRGNWRTVTTKDAANLYGFAPIGTSTDPFQGTFNGQGHVINALTINRPSKDNVGLFGYVNSATLKSVGLENVSVTGKTSVGGLLGYGSSASINKTFVTGAVAGTGSAIGGLAGNVSGGSISVSYTTGTVSSSSTHVGGLVGVSGTSISDVYTTASVTGTGFVGGLAGQSSSTITRAYASGKVTGGSGFVGTKPAGTISSSFWDIDTTGQASGGDAGAVGIYSSTSTQNAFNQAIYAGWNFTNTWYMVDGETRPFLRMDLEEFGKTYDAAGNGIAGTYTIRNANQLQLIKSHDGATSSGKTYILANDIDLTATLANDAGIWRTTTTKSAANLYGFVPIGSSSNGFKGIFDGQGHVISGLTINRPLRDGAGLFGYTDLSTIKNAGLVGSSVSGKDSVGTLVGNSINSNISNIYITGTVFGNNHVGGLIGYSNSGAIYGVNAVGDVTGTGNYVGGLVGSSLTNIQNAYATGNVTGIDQIGGLVGFSHNNITNAYATGTVLGNSRVGGLVGYGDGGVISSAYAMGNVTGTGNYVGGLVGYSQANIQNAYATGNVVGIDQIGGLVGFSNNDITNTYATGSVTGTGSYIGGLAGYRDNGTITSSFWNKDAIITGIGYGSDVGTMGLTLAQFKSTAEFMGVATGWDFNNIWAPPGDGYSPELYALSKVLRVQATSNATVVYGSSSVTWVGGGPSGSIVYGQGKHISGDTSYGSQSTFGSSPSLAVNGLNAGSYMNEVTGLIRGGDGKDTYRYIYTLDLIVTKATLTITADGGQSKVYGGADPTLSYAASGLVNGDTDSVMTGALDRVAGNDVGTYAINQGTLSAGGNYTINLVPGQTFAITPAALTITADSGQSKVYGGADPTLSYAASGLVNGDTTSVMTGALDRVAGNNVGTYAINQGTLSAGGNYTITFVPGQTFAITPAALTITADSGQSKIYGGADPTLSYAASGLVNGDTTSVMTGALDRVAGNNVGTYAINQGTLSAGGNYTITFVPGQTFAITPATLTITADSGQSKVYGGVDPTLSYAASGLVNGDTDSLITGALDRVAGNNVGTYAINQGTLSAGGNYTITFVPGQTFAITPATLTITADSGQSKVYGGADPTLSYAASGFVNGDTASVMTGALDRVAGNNVGIYGINQGTLSAGGNYTINLVPGPTFAITPAVLTITTDSGQSKVYGTADPTLSYAVSGLVNGDTISIMTGALDRVAGNNVGSYAINQGTLSAGGNYTMNIILGQAFAITPATLTVSGGVVQSSRVYDGTTDIFVTNHGAILSGVVGSDDITVSLNAAYASANAGTHIHVNGIYSISGAAAGNYILADAAFQTKAAITAKSLMIATPGQVTSQRIYDGTAFAQKLSDGTLNGVVAADIGRVGLELIDTRYNSANVAEANTVTGRYLLSGTAAHNYILTASEFSTTGIITQAQLTVNPMPGQVRTVGQSDYQIAFTISGWKGGDNASLLAGELSFEGADAPGTRFITLGNLQAGGNYNLELTSGGVLEIVARPSDNDGAGGGGLPSNPNDQIDAIAHARELEKTSSQLLFNTEKERYVMIDPFQFSSPDSSDEDSADGSIQIGKSGNLRCVTSSVTIASDAQKGLSADFLDCHAIADMTTSTSNARR
ncbi:beta strand repeat-containing protein [Pseudochelatococcus sp. G4_1912]|uniref:beta strand repeat-containing protein n=1 Tax=Pseudochelatococcus sp. G4_1912 TaxID=3114288 RepID=UPI0039C6AF5F